MYYKLSLLCSNLLWYLAPGRLEVAVSRGMPRNATSSSDPSDIGAGRMGSLMKDATPPALCKSLGLVGSKNFFHWLLAVNRVLFAEPWDTMVGIIRSATLLAEANILTQLFYLEKQFLYLFDRCSSSSSAPAFNRLWDPEHVGGQLVNLLCCCGLSSNKFEID